MKRVLVTRQPSQSVELINLLSQNNLYPFLLPMIETLPVKFKTETKDYDYIVFSSANAVKYFIEYFDEFNFKKIIAIGEKTAKYLEQFDIYPDLVPYEFSSEGLIEELKDKDLKNKTFLIPGPKNRSGNLKDFLIKNDAFVNEIIIYETKPVLYKKSYIEKFLNENKIDFITFASPSAAEAFFSQITNLPEKIKFISIGKVTYNYLKEINIESVYPKKYTAKDMVNLILSLKE